MAKTQAARRTNGKVNGNAPTIRNDGKEEMARYLEVGADADVDGYGVATLLLKATRDLVLLDCRMTDVEGEPMMLVMLREAKYRH